MRIRYAILLVLWTGLHVAVAQKHPRKPDPAQPAAGVELATDPAFHSVFQNERVRVWKLDLAGGAGTELDRYTRDFLVLALTPAKLELAGGSTQLLEMHAAEMQVVKGGWAHKTINRGSEAAGVILMEPQAPLNPEHAVCGLSARPCRSGEIGNILGDYTQSQLFETETALLSKFEVAAGATAPGAEQKYDALLIATGDCRLRDRSGPEEAPHDRELNLKAGEVGWLVAGTRHAFTNTGEQSARFLLLEFK